ncbi:MAG: hypothetical protein A4S17_01355 [Proteobacteria bacterium HN_bin10]|nr:MAG: hypothetical protein A4S17_01355 [Proteobacteria bacterium HN_bin10]
MGGHAGGEVASRLTVAAWEAEAGTIADGRSATHEELARRLNAATVQAHQAVRQEAARTPALAGMGTTLVALHIVPAGNPYGPPYAAVAHVGDSRAYLARAGGIHALTRDHSWVEEQLAKGLLSTQEALAHPYRHVLTRAIGIDEQSTPDIGIVSLEPRDRLLLCTDGLTKMLSDDEIAGILAASPQRGEQVCSALVQAALDRGGVDNVTVILVWHESTGR